VVLNPWNIDALQVIEKETGKKVNNILQLRLHPAIAALKEKIEKGPKDKMYDIDLSYITSRGKWYHASWKGDISKSGGVATNIGVHFFDMLTWIFGDIKENIVHYSSATKIAGFLQLKQARVRWFLSVDYDDIPEQIKKQGKRTYRVLNIDGSEFEFSEGFTDLHTRIYEEILKGKGYSMEDCRKSIEAVYTIKNAVPAGLKGDYHPMCKNIIKE
jgi:UDP-N-acetyl-2-amino-2-deoxyglucuronate dehydrogenase